MPNWCEGTLKLRGAKDNILKFMNENIFVQTGSTVKDGEKFPTIDEELIKFEFDTHKEEIEWNKETIKNKTVRLNGVRRGFITLPDYIELYSETPILVLDFQVAWGIIPAGKQNYLKLANKYNLDLRFKGYECGGEFEQLFEIINNEITKYEEITYDDYEWECDFPKIGG